MDGARDGMENNGKKQLASNNLVIVQLGCLFATVWPGIDEILLFYDLKQQQQQQFQLNRFRRSTDPRSLALI